MVKWNWSWFLFLGGYYLNKIKKYHGRFEPGFILLWWSFNIKHSFWNICTKQDAVYLGYTLRFWSHGFNRFVGSRTTLLNVVHVEHPCLQMSGNCFIHFFLKSSQFCLEWLSSLENVALSPVTVLKWLAVDPVHRNPRKVLLVWLVVSELICCWNCPCCFRLQFETADDEDFIAVQNAIEEVISELKILPGFSSLEEVRVNAVTLMREFGWWYVDRNQ